MYYCTYLRRSTQFVRWKYRETASDPRRCIAGAKTSNLQHFGSPLTTFLQKSYIIQRYLWFFCFTRFWFRQGGSSLPQVADDACSGSICEFWTLWILGMGTGRARNLSEIFKNPSDLYSSVKARTALNPIRQRSLRDPIAIFRSHF